MNKQMFNEELDQLPCTLKRAKATQEWFASIITRPLEDGNINPYAPNGELIAEDEARYIIQNATLRPSRLQVYNQQYWWRLLKTLHVNFPLVTRLFGTLAFNEEIGIPYLLKYPPNHWSLTQLGERLPKWIAECYREPDQSLLFNAASLDWAFMASFIAPQYSPLSLSSSVQADPESLLSFTFYLQPHINLFKWDYDLLTFRESFLKEEADYWIEHRFPELQKERTYCFVLYRNSKNNIAWREISEGEFMLLERFKLGTTITSACEYMENQEASLYEEVENNLEKWLQEWIQTGLLTLTAHEEKT